jgi:hypothetical protein
MIGVRRRRCAAKARASFERLGGECANREARKGRPIPVQALHPARILRTETQRSGEAVTIIPLSSRPIRNRIVL